jgi:hypothetical protein
MAGGGGTPRCEQPGRREAIWTPTPEHDLDNFIRGADHFADLDVVVQERHELAPRVLPQLGDGRVEPAPFVGELAEPGPSFGFGGGGVDRSQIPGDLVPVLP